MKGKKRIPTNDDAMEWASPFAALKHVALPASSQTKPATDQTHTTTPASKKNRGRLDILRQTAHRGGKTVTVVTGFVGISQEEKERLAKTIQQTCGTGGTVKEGRIEIQGDHRTTVARILTEAGFRPVFAGG
jgi:translation initiation factor 1